MKAETPESKSGTRFGSDDRADPCGPFPELLWRGRPYNLALTEAILIPFLEECKQAAAGGRRPPGPGDQVQTRPAPGKRGAGGWGPLGRAADAALAQCAEAFRTVLPQAARSGDAAVLAALTVTANLQRTLERLAREPDSPEVLSRYWCGFSPDAVPRRPKAGRTAAGRPRSGPDLRLLARALRCSYAEIRDQCDHALAALRQEIREGVLFAPEDLPASAVRKWPRSG